MSTIETLAEFLEELAPVRLAEDWDNVGLLVGDSSRPVRRVMTCLTITPSSAAEAVRRRVDLIVTHHPLPFQPLKRLTSETPTGRMLLDLIRADVAVYSAHTAFDSAAEGINQRLAEGLGLAEIVPLVPDEDGLGAGRRGRPEPPCMLDEMVERVKRFLGIDRLQFVGDLRQPVRAMAVACGAAGEFLDAARQTGCDTMLVGETRFHTLLAAEAGGVNLLLPGHFASERFALECLAESISGRFPDLEVWASQTERDPIEEK